jgi:hypothetical protein
MSCLFNSLQYFIPSLTPLQIRHQICDYLFENNPVIDGLDTREMLSLIHARGDENYIEEMRNSSTWGTAIEIQAACNIWRTAIIVKNIRDNPSTNITFTPVNSAAQSTISVSWSGNHYEPQRE